MVLRTTIAALVCAAIASAAQSQSSSLAHRTDGDKGQQVTETKHLKLSVSANPRLAGTGGKVSLLIDVEPKPKMHVYAPDQKEYIPIALPLTPDAVFRAQPIRFPPAETYFFAPLKETQRVYSKPFRIEQPVTLAAKAGTGDVTIKGTVRYQACDDAICYVPQNVPVSWTIALKK